MSSGAVVFECPVCRVPITKPLLSLKPGMALCLEDGRDAVPLGYFGTTTEDYWSDGGSRVLVNLNDLVGTEHHQDPRRLNGCCGLDGCDGPNLVCPKGHEIGTERSDCWMAHVASSLNA